MNIQEAVLLCLVTVMLFLSLGQHWWWRRQLRCVCARVLQNPYFRCGLSLIGFWVGFWACFLLLLLGLLNVNGRDESYTLFEFVEKYQ